VDETTGMRESRSSNRILNAYDRTESSINPHLYKQKDEGSTYISQHRPIHIANRQDDEYGLEDLELDVDLRVCRGDLKILDERGQLILHISFSPSASLLAKVRLERKGTYARGDSLQRDEPLQAPYTQRYDLGILRPQPKRDRFRERIGILTT
jgi:hypothetical protein